MLMRHLLFGVLVLTKAYKILDGYRQQVLYVLSLGEMISCLLGTVVCIINNRKCTLVLSTILVCPGCTHQYRYCSYLATLLNGRV